MFLFSLREREKKNEAKKKNTTENDVKQATFKCNVITKLTAQAAATATVVEREEINEREVTV